MEKPDSLINDLGRMLGLDLALDENGQCLLMLDDRLIVSIKAADDAFVLYGMVGQFPLDASNEVMRRILGLNLAFSEENFGSLALDESNDALMLIKHVSAQSLSSQEFEVVVQHFVNHLENIMDLIEAVN